MKLPTGPLGWWQSIVRNTWRAFMIFGGAVCIAILLRSYGGHYRQASWMDIGQEFGGALGLMFFVSFFVSLAYHWQVRRNSRWPGGGGPRDR